MLEDGDRSEMPSRPSPFFYPPPRPVADSLAILHLKRDSLLPVELKSAANDGYAEGAVTNTRFGSFPHTTLIGLDWGSQVRASRVDTGSRGRRGKKAKPDEGDDSNSGVAGIDIANKKRKADDKAQDSITSPAKKLKVNGKEIAQQDSPVPAKVPVGAGSGFIHILPPTPESWTSSLDHRTQVVYTPDYSYILQRLRVKPGSHMIEAGAGSGSFTHAAARAVFNGYPPTSSPASVYGKVYSFEYHEPRVQTLRDEITSHGLDDIVELTHRDVCNDGFLLSDATPPSVDAIFLDLPAPWLALKHLTRSAPHNPLTPDGAIHLCTFSPCIEQVMATVSALRREGWTEIGMTEVQHKRIDVRRERVGLKEEGLRGVNAGPANIAEAVGRLRDVESKAAIFHRDKSRAGSEAEGKKGQGKQERLERLRREAEERKLYKEGKLVHRSEPEMKTHTSYLVFAILPRTWSEADEAAALAQYRVDEIMRPPPETRTEAPIGDIPKP